MSVDEEYLVLRKDGKGYQVLLVYGNDGYDVIADYASDLEPLMVKPQALADKLCDEMYS